MGTYGDGGNAVVLRQRLRLRGIAAEIVEITLDDPVPDSPGPVHAGWRGGLRAAAGHPAPDQVPGVAARGRSGARPCWRSARRSRCSGHWYETSSGERVDGVGMLDVTTSPQSRTHHRRAGQQAVARRAVSVQLTGFENHRGGTVLGPAASPLGAVVKGAGNRAGDGFDGAIQGSVVATYMHGPCLARNPELGRPAAEQGGGRSCRPLASRGRAVALRAVSCPLT